MCVCEGVCVCVCGWVDVECEEGGGVSDTKIITAKSPN